MRTNYKISKSVSGLGLLLVVNIDGYPATRVREFHLWTKNVVRCVGPGLVFTKGLRVSQVIGLNVVLKLRLLSQLSFVLKPYSQRVT